MTSLTCSIQAQVDISPSFLSKLEQAGIEFLAPLENSYRNLEVHDNSLQAYELAILHRKQKVEIRYVVEPLPEDTSQDIPHIFFAKKAINIAANTDDSVLSIHTMKTQQLQEDFNADWGAIAFFQPKLEFSTKAHCKMVAVHAEGKGNLYIFYLFDDPQTDLEELFATVRFY